MNQTYASGPSKSIKVYPGDKVDAEVWAYYEGASGYGTGSPGVAAMVTAIATGFGGVSGGAGESGKIYDGINSALGGFGLGGNVGDAAPAAYLNYILFDQQYKVLDMGWIRVPTTAYFSRQKISLAQVNVKEAGFVFVYLSYEDQSNNFVYFDEFKITHTKSNLIQGNEYYPFGMQTANSWTRENATANNYLANGGTELNPTSQLYDLYYRNFDPALGRMFQVDPMASKYGSLTPYNYSLNNPTNLNDPLGDDVEPQPPYPREYQCAMCWREGQNLTNYMRVSGGGMYGGWSGGGFYGGSGPMGAYWHPGDGRMFWSGYESGARSYRHDQDRVRNNDMSLYDFYSKYPGYTSYGGGPQALISVLNHFGYRFVKTPTLASLKASLDFNESVENLNFQDPTLPSTAELNRRFGPSFQKFIVKLKTAFPDNTGTPTGAYMQSIMNYIEDQDWQEILEDSDNPKSGHNMHLVNTRMRMYSIGAGQVGLVDSYDRDFMGFPPTGERIHHSTMPWAGVVHNPDHIPGSGQILIQVDSTTYILILMEFNYILPK